MNELALFAGIGGGILGGQLLGWRTICAVENDPYAASVLVARQNDGSLPAFPIWSDICDFDGTRWRGRVDVISGGFPCQDVSSAGSGKGLSGKRSGLWYEMLRVVREVRSRYVFIENSPLLRRRGLHAILNGLAEAGYHATWAVLGAADLGAPHIRKRMWILAEAIRGDDVADPDGERRIEDEVQAGKPCLTLEEAPAKQSGGTGCTQGDGEVPSGAWSTWWDAEPELGRLVDGCPDSVERLTALGNAQVPIVAATAFRFLAHRLRTFDTPNRA